MTSEDQKIESLRKTIKEQTKANKRPSGGMKTNGKFFQYDGRLFNVVIASSWELVGVLTILLAMKKLDPTIKHGDSPIQDIISDVKYALAKRKYTDKANILKQLQGTLNGLESEEAKRSKSIDSVADLVDKL